MPKGIYEHKPHSGSFKKGNIPHNKGRKLSKEHKEKIKLSNLGKNRGKRPTLETRKKMGLSKMGNKNHKYIDGKSKDRTHYESFEYKLWRNAVFMRDDYKCKNCKRKGIYIEAHHIKGWSQYPELRFAIDNGLTLCKECHKLTDNYGFKGARIKKQNEHNKHENL